MKVKHFNTRQVFDNSGVAFGTSGVRGLVDEFTPEVCSAFMHSFVDVIKDEINVSVVAIAIDNRPSSPRIAQHCISALNCLGIDTIYFGVVPTPALAFISIKDKIPSIMITGSHIPFDRNGIKFYRHNGEINKKDEYRIYNASIDFDMTVPESEVNLSVNTSAMDEYINRYVSLFPCDFFKNKRIGIYEHSSAGREIYYKVFQMLGAEVIRLGRSDEFVPIDTEAVSQEDIMKAREWSSQYKLDMIFSTDGDGDRPLVSDEHGEWIRGDILGLLCSRALSIEAVALPVSCNTAIDSSGFFESTVKTKIGSPYVIDALNDLKAKYKYVAGFEANGGFMLGSDIEYNGNIISSLPTRDALLPALMVLALSTNQCISSLTSKLPQRFTFSDRIQNFPASESSKLISAAMDNPSGFISKFGLNLVFSSVDLTDGVRFLFSNGDVVHLRASGNAPELRCYAESDCLEKSISYVNSIFKELEKSVQI
nr:phosphomannomutase [Enterobacter hormaechei]